MDTCEEGYCRSKPVPECDCGRINEGWVLCKSSQSCVPDCSSDCPVENVLGDHGVCVKPSTKTCGKLGKFYCGHGSEWEQQCVDSCRQCEDPWAYNGVCYSDCGKMFGCPNTGKCVEHCTDCKGGQHISPLHVGENNNVCRKASPTTCGALHFCPTSGSCVHYCAKECRYNPDTVGEFGVCGYGGPPHEDTKEPTVSSPPSRSGPCDDYYCEWTKTRVKSCCRWCQPLGKADEDQCRCSLATGPFEQLMDKQTFGDHQVFAELIEFAFPDPNKINRCGITVFPFTDAAWDKLPPNSRAAIFNDRGLAKRFAQMHVVDGEYNYDELLEMYTVKAWSGQFLTVANSAPGLSYVFGPLAGTFYDVEGQTTYEQWLSSDSFQRRDWNKGNLLHVNQYADNGIIHSIDEVLAPSICTDSILGGTVPLVSCEPLIVCDQDKDCAGNGHMTCRPANEFICDFANCANPGAPTQRENLCFARCKPTPVLNRLCDTNGCVDGYYSGSKFNAAVVVGKYMFSFESELRAMDTTEASSRMLFGDQADNPIQATLYPVIGTPTDSSPDYMPEHEEGLVSVGWVPNFGTSTPRYKITTTWFRINTAGEYTFGVTAQAATQLWIDDYLVVFNGGVKASAALISGVAHMSARPHKVRVEAYGPGPITVTYNGPDTANTDVDMTTVAMTPPEAVMNWDVCEPENFHPQAIPGSSEVLTACPEGYPASVATTMGAVYWEAGGIIIGIHTTGKIFEIDVTGFESTWAVQRFDEILPSGPSPTFSFYACVHIDGNSVWVYDSTNYATSVWEYNAATRTWREWPQHPDCGTPPTGVGRQCAAISSHEILMGTADSGGSMKILDVSHQPPIWVDICTGAECGVMPPQGAVSRHYWVYSDGVVYSIDDLTSIGLGLWALDTRGAWPGFPVEKEGSLSSPVRNMWVELCSATSDANEGADAVPGLIDSCYVGESYVWANPTQKPLAWEAGPGVIQIASQWGVWELRTHSVAPTGTLNRVFHQEQP
eukprot:TRINITY_DN67651_c4_g5_i1.p1 TRINITY_DN67651_c4_g5~~TRINITY_DN67651_c4_g5_i1.p1  ORF type:complete len:1104 (-),score=105.62 TRINITY_DN67651_c4_g5_i1:1980-4985(-)